MDAKKHFLHEFIGEKRTFVIPVYQRNYDWKIENCERLFGDIVRIIENKKAHFIGTFVYMENFSADIFRDFIIIDGQQRITSIILFAKALYDSTDDEYLREDIRSTFIKHSRGELRGKCKLRPTEYDAATFEKLMSENAFDENNFTDEEKKSAMFTNFNFFRDKLSAQKFSAKELFNATEKLTVVSIMLEDENPQEIFESLNSTGLDLSKADLIRNFLLMSLEYGRQEELYKNYWLEIEKLLHSSDKVENFITQYLIMKRKSSKVQENKNRQLSDRNLYNVFKDYFKKNYAGGDVEDFLKDLLRYAKFFSRVIFDENANFENLSALDKKFYELTYLLDAVNAPIILMYLLDRYEKNSFDEETFIAFVDALISLTFRSKVCGNTGITSQFAGNVLPRLDNKTLDTDLFWRALTFGKRTFSFPNDKDFQAALVNKNLYQILRSNLCKYLLYSLERAARSRELPVYSKATVEHILPQKLNDAWKKYLATRNDSSAHEIWLHTLGNLTLTEYNSELGNAAFDRKKEIYSQSNYPGTRALANYSEWTAAQIQLRAKKLAASAIKIWTLPEEFNKTAIDIGEIFTLDSDFRALTGTRPATLFIANTEIKISTWINLLREVARQLYALDKNIFRQATELENVRQSLFTSEPTNFKLDENLYMIDKIDTRTCLRNAKNLVENFDMLGGTNFKEDIYFTLKN